jgi:outer membrane usher protein
VIASALGSHAGRAQDSAPQAQVVIEPGRPAAELNPTGRSVTLTVPVMDGDAYLGDATLTLDPDGRASFSATRLLALIAPRVREDLAARLRGRLAQGGGLTGADLESIGVGAAYDPQTLEIRLTIAGASRGSSVIGLSDGSGRAVAYMTPAEVSAYLNVRGAVDWVQQGPDEGLSPPVMFIDGAARWRGVVLESELNLQPGAAGADYQRRGTRLVHDDRERLVRWTADHQPWLPVGSGNCRPCGQQALFGARTGHDHPPARQPQLPARSPVDGRSAHERQSRAADRARTGRLRSSGFPVHPGGQ